MTETDGADAALIRNLKVDLMQAEIANKRADTDLKREQLRWEPWKALSVAFGAGAAVATGLLTLGGWLFSHLH